MQLSFDESLDFNIGNCNIKSLLDSDLVQRLNKIMSLSSADVRIRRGCEYERNIPSEKRFLKNRWYRFMLARYIFATCFTRGKTVLDSCCGLGWGSYILAHNAIKVYANDCNENALGFINSYWNEPKIETVSRGALSLELSQKVDVVVMMESIEHFSKEEGKVYIENLVSHLVPGGTIVGSSVFPKSRKKAQMACNKNPKHEHIYTLIEIRDLLQKNFKNIEIFNSKFFTGVKK